jgi:hypothetical protein
MDGEMKEPGAALRSGLFSYPGKILSNIIKLLPDECGEFIAGLSLP